MSNGTLRFATLNVRSLRHKLDEVSSVLTSNSIDLVALTDTGLEAWFDLAAISGHRLVARVDRRDSSQGQGGGVVIIPKCGLFCHSMPATNPLSVLVRAVSLFVGGSLLILLPQPLTGVALRPSYRRRPTYHQNEQNN
eukprot:GHVN01036147.1.p1 GENE.GHVN01036147.1~~GHVN01036147.1.p1  ORF type:complete len:138 (-),score=16.74 GHVN01036147.1:77-490(-)